MSKTETKNDLINIKSLGEFESTKLMPFFTELEKLRKEIGDLSDMLREKRNIINEKIEEETAREYENAMKEMALEEPVTEIVEEIVTTLPDTVNNEPVIEQEKTETVIEKAEEPVKEVKEEKPVAKKSILETIPELKMKSRPKSKEEASEMKGRVFIPDNSTKPSGQPYNNRYTDNLPRSRRPNEGEVRSKTSPNQQRPFRQGGRPFADRPTQGGQGPKTGIKPLKTSLLKAAETPVFAPKDTRPAIKKKDDKKGEEVKKAMDKRTLIRRGFIDNMTPGAAIDFDDEGRHFKAKKLKKSEFTPQTLTIEKAVINTETVPIKVLSEKIGKTGAQIIKQLFILGIVKTINESIDFETAELVANELGVELEQNLTKSSEDLLEEQFNTKEDDVNLKPRPPVVTIMGHVDHGKTSLLDYIRKANVVSSEAGGITQHIGAYTVELKNQKITFIDTPGHEAFTAMRLRGAQVTDIAVIVVAADDGIMPQTIEAIAHAKASNVSIIIAINKMDKKTANPDRIKQQLTEHELVPEEWGGDIICVPVSAVTGEGVDNLLESVLLVAEMKELKSDYDHYAKGVIIEAQLDKGRGPVATVLVQSGTLKVSDYIVAGTVIGKIRAMVDDKGNMIKAATPSMPVQIQGFDEVPQAGDTLSVVSDDKLARKVIEDRRINVKSGMTVNKAGTSLEDMFTQIAEGDIKDLNIIIKGDVQGSVEAIKQELLKLSNEEVRVNIVQASVGAVTESDVMLAESSKSIILGFNVRPDSKAKKMSERSNIDIRVYRIIYDIINDITLALKGMLKPKFTEIIVGRAEVRAIFKISGAGTIAGCYVIEDKIVRNAKLRLLRNNVIIYEGNIASLKRMKDDVKEVAQGFECGISIEGFNDIKEGDIIEAFLIEEVKA